MEEELAAFASYLYEQARSRLIRRRIKVDDSLLNSLAVTTAKNELEMWFQDHGRMHDMGAGNAYHKGKFVGVEQRGRILKGRKGSKWYGPLAWGSVYGTLVNNLANKYIAQVPALLVQEYNKA